MLLLSLLPMCLHASCVRLHTFVGLCITHQKGIGAILIPSVSMWLLHLRIAKGWCICRAEQHGMRVASTVSGSTKCLIQGSAGKAKTASAKAREAEQRSVPIISSGNALAQLARLLEVETTQ